MLLLLLKLLVLIDTEFELRLLLIFNILSTICAFTRLLARVIIPYSIGFGARTQPSYPASFVSSKSSCFRFIAVWPLQQEPLNRFIMIELNYLLYSLNPVSLEKPLLAVCYVRYSAFFFIESIQFDRIRLSYIVYTA